MPICVECGSAVDNLYTEYSKGHIYMTRCEGCGRIADKYIEFDSVIIFIEMVLHKPQVYRHLLYNTDLFTPPGASRWQRWSRWGKLCLLMILFDVYIKWSQIERRDVVLAEHGDFLTTYMYLFIICSLEFLIFQIAVSQVSRIVLRNRESAKDVLLALVLSSFGKLVHILMLIWNFNELEYSWLVNASVLTSNAEALAALLKTNYWRAYGILGVSIGVKLAFQLLLSHYDAKFPVILF